MAYVGEKCWRNFNLFFASFKNLKIIAISICDGAASHFSFGYSSFRVDFYSMICGFAYFSLVNHFAIVRRVPAAGE